jgi:hypothetical protein
MLRKVTTVLLILAVAGIALAAGPSVSGKITAIGDNQVTITLDGEKADWVKKNALVKFPNAVGKVLEVSAADGTPVVIIVKTRKASTMTVGDAITFQKGKAMAGC